MNRFDAKAVAELATSLLNDNGGKPPRKPRRNAAAAHEVKRTEGEIAAEVFERLEQRQSLAEIKQIVDRYGGGAFRITAYGLEPRGLRWEVLVQVGF